MFCNRDFPRNYSCLRIHWFAKAIHALTVPFADVYLEVKLLISNIMHSDTIQLHGAEFADSTDPRNAQYTFLNQYGYAGDGKHQVGKIIALLKTTSVIPSDQTTLADEFWRQTSCKI